ncbi:MAG: sensor histidine kinase [Acidimicrobiales bacterium]
MRARLLIAVAVIALVALGGADVATYSAFRSYLNGQLDTTLQTSVVPLQTCLEQGGRLTVPLVEESAPGIFAEVRTASGRVVASVPATDEDSRLGLHLEDPLLSTRIVRLTFALRATHASGPMSDDCRDTITPAVLPGPGVLRRPPEAVGGKATTNPALPGSFQPTSGLQHGAALYFTTAAQLPDQPQYRVRTSRLVNGDALILGVPLTETGNSLSRLVYIELGVSGMALVVALFLGFILVRVGVRPLVEVEQTAELIMEGDLGARVPERFRASTEMGRLTRVLNLMLGRLSEDFEERDRTAKLLTSSEARMRQFLADASHELRTPISAVSAYAELFSRGADSRPADLERILHGIQTETARMSRLVADLLLLSNLDEGRPLELRPVELVALSAEAVYAAAAVGAEWRVLLSATEPVEVMGDEVRLRQVLDNLLANIRAHTPPGTAGSVRVRQEGSEAVIEVADSGPGLGAEGRRRVFERFFREDTSRARASGGAGLGLAIVQAIVRAHRGSVEVSRTPGGGATFAVRLPAISEPGPTA